MQPRDLTKYPLQVGEEVIFKDKQGRIISFTDGGEFASLSSRYLKVPSSELTPVHRFPPMPEKWAVLVTDENLQWAVKQGDSDIHYLSRYYHSIPMNGNKFFFNVQPCYTEITESMRRYWMVEQKNARDYAASDIHELKVWPQYMEDLITGMKTFEVRKFDRDFKVGDTLVLSEWDNENAVFLSRKMQAKVTYILPGGQFGIEPGFCVMGIARF